MVMYDHNWSARERFVMLVRSAEAHAREHLEKFEGLTESEAIALADAHELIIRMCPAAGCEQDYAMPGGVTAFVESGIIVRTLVGLD